MNPPVRLQEPGNSLALVNWSAAARGSAAAAVDVLPEARAPGAPVGHTAGCRSTAAAAGALLDAGEPTGAPAGARQQPCPG
ncbi:hypothetical protein GC101_17705 [Paenibacillus sp. LMG 31459]|uniref:Uncharacterized protein n=1 Tax=Paenibacillus phytohabitans TaxID=2654978 RepID=A0ABX1YI59_9BACL|nr:hypothetical protein [Paenibacillus phytohabitans]